MKINHSNFAVYQPSEAARLIRIPAGQIKRWIDGYTNSTETTRKEHPPLWERRYSDSDECYLGFLDLIEIRFVNAFVKAGLTVQTVRVLLNKARDVINSDYPLSSQKFKTDGKTIFLELLEKDKTKTIDIRDGQHSFHSFVKPSFKDLDFESEVVSKWYVQGRDKKVSIDPNIAFGQPVVDTTGITTARIKEALEAEKDIKTVARIFEISTTQVRHAVEFERRIAQPF